MAKGATIVAAAILLAAASGTQSQNPEPRRGLFAPLKVGQPVVVREKAERYEVSVFDGRLGSHTIIEIGTDFLVVEDVGKVITLRLPIYSVKAVVVVKSK